MNNTLYERDIEALRIIYHDACQAANAAAIRAAEIGVKLDDALLRRNVVDIESYRKPGTEFYTVKEVK